jgi:hypothetical protein
MSDLASGGSNLPGGAYAQPAPGIVIQAVVPYRDTQPTVQAAAVVTGAGAGATIATITPGAAGLWEISGTVSIEGTTTTADSNNMRLRQNSTSVLALIPYGVASTGFQGAVPFGPVVVSLAAADTVNVVAIAAAGGSAVYGAQIVARQVG